MKTEEQVYNEVLNYIKSSKHNRPCTLASIKKVLRSQRIVDLIFSRPDIFKLASEFKHVPEECLTESVLVKYILSDYENFYSLDESLQTLPLMIAFEFSKRRHERIFKWMWGPYDDGIRYSGKILEYQSAVSELCNEVFKRISSNPDESCLLHNYLEYIETASREILSFCATFEQELEKDKKYIAKYINVDFDIPERLFIFVSGCPDTGKTVFSNILSSRTQNSIHLDSDVLLERNLLDQPLANLIRNDIKVVIFSDIYADRFFKKDELGNARVINILMKPISIETMHRNSKYMAHIPFEDYKKHEIDKIHYDSLDNPIIVINNYNGQIIAEVDNALEKIASRIGVTLSPREPVIEEKQQNLSVLKKVLKSNNRKTEVVTEDINLF